jgi:Rps23 Pro-64 3,4-dihydroxylase Tpa1-like proline 4-hydroxylase
MTIEESSASASASASSSSSSLKPARNIDNNNNNNMPTTDSTTDSTTAAAAGTSKKRSEPTTTTTTIHHHDLSSSSSNKKLKSDSVTSTSSFHPNLLSHETTASLRSQYDSSAPYKHIAIQDLISDDLLRAVRNELLQNVHLTPKETDIYKVNQSGDLANMDGLPKEELAQLKNLHTLRNALYSEEFRRFVEQVTGVERLSPSKKDLSHNNYTEGCHLICHDDVIGTRSVSYILYLTDPDEPWRSEEGGALELFPVVSKGTPAVDPTLIIPPKWNQLCMFAVQPGLSFHSVAEVVVGKGRSRLSISGWFHVLQEGDMTEEEKKRVAEEKKLKGEEEEKAKASLDQLTSDEDGLEFEVLEPLTRVQCDKKEEEEEELEWLTEQEMEQLKPFINPLYLNPAVIAQANEKFIEESSIQLTSFLQPQLADEIKKAIYTHDKADGYLDHIDNKAIIPPVPDYSKGVHGGWSPLGPAHKQRFLTLDSNKLSQISKQTDPAAYHFNSIQRDLFPSVPFRRLLALITSLKTTKYRALTRRFRPGMDYTLATTSGNSGDEIKDAEGNIIEKPEGGVLDVSLCFVSERNAKEKLLWDSDEVGGFECYMAPDEGNEDPAQYRAADVEDGGGALLSVSASSNNLNVVMRAKDSAGVMKFVKFVSSRAPGSRWDVAGEYRYEEDDDDEEEDDE